MSEHGGLFGDRHNPAGFEAEPGFAAADTFHAEVPPARQPEAQPRIVAELVFPDLADWQPVLDRLGVSTEERIGLAAAAQAKGWPLPIEAVAAGLASEEAVHSAFAECLGLELEAEVEPRRLILERDEDAVMLLGARRRGLLVRREGREGMTAVLLSAARTGFAELRGQTFMKPGLRGRLRLVPPSMLRAALWSRAAPRLLRLARLELFERHPLLSARIVLNAWQGAAATLLAVALLAGFGFFPHAALLTVHVVASLFFLGCVGLRGAALLKARRLRLAPLPPDTGEERPVYSVLVALYREAPVVPQLLQALGRLDWPVGRLEVKLVCEADDRETIDAVHRAAPPPFVEVVEVPAAQPRTKPKALNYALPGTTGEFVVIFDAEDRPHPAQLREAWGRFRAGGPDLGCLQAPLVVANRERGYLPRMFSFEYAALFRGLLPHLARLGPLLPLGGTSSHFRRECLDTVCAWDPFNVTEDADLGVRLARFGYRTETISRPTLEDAPEDFKVWMAQRVRWFKGYMQTWLVHMREPARLCRELGSIRTFLIMQILFAGKLVSALVHPLLVTTFAVLLLALAGGAELSPANSALLVIDAVNIGFGYGFLLALGWRTLSGKERRSFLKVVLGTPVYWMMMSLAAWAALWQLWRAPYHWNKTPHRPAAEG